MDRVARSDEECIRRVQAGETEAFETLVRRHQKAIFNLLYRWFGNYDEATEVAQEVFLSAYRAIHRYRSQAAFSTWLYRIAVNHAKNRSKSLTASRDRLLRLEAADPIEDATSDPAATAERQEIQKRVQEALTSLPEHEAAVILLHDLQGLAQDEVAEVLDVPLGTVKSRLHRARTALKAKLTPLMESLREH